VDDSCRPHSHTNLDILMCEALPVQTLVLTKPALQNTYYLKETASRDFQTLLIFIKHLS
jgi:hypothetical protein